MPRRSISRRFFPAISVLLAIVSTICAADSAAPLHETPQERDARMAWFRDAKFGMFIHWGLYSVPGGVWKDKQEKACAEWAMETLHIPVSEYEKYRDQFNPVQFDAKRWVQIAKDAGMKYIVITSKHHEGFAMFDTKLTDWGIMSTPWKHDPIKDLAEECQKAGIKFCFYHSIMDWHHPDYAPRHKTYDKAGDKPDFDRYVKFMKGQLKELLTNYGPIGILWFDGQWEDTWTKDRGCDLYNYVRSLQPAIIINNRVGKPENTAGGGMAKTGDVGDYGTPEQTIPDSGFGPGVDWESCMTMNDSWGYSKVNHNWKSPETVVRMLIDCASKGGNFLLNVGPTPEGSIPAPSVECLAKVGQWTKVNHDAIYGTTSSPFPKAPVWGRVTQKPGKLYFHVFDWPSNQKLVVPALEGKKAVSASLLANGESLPIHTTSDGVVIDLPAKAPDAIASVIVLDVAPQ
jgi:alpha-L-fucosidase